MRNENRAVFDRASEHHDLAFELPALPDTESPEADERLEQPSVRRSWLAGLIDRIVRTMRSRRNRLALEELSDDQLKDIGVARCQAEGGFARYRQSEAHNLEKTCR